VNGHALTTGERPDSVSPGSEVTVSVRPEDVHLLAGTQEGENRIGGTVAFVRDVGQSVELYIDCGDLRITSHVQPRDKPDVGQGDAVTVELPASSCVVLPR
jgi:putative spermidine/putrescine transport system ATP-binding protein